MTSKIHHCASLTRPITYCRLTDNQVVINMGRIAWVLVIFVVVMHIMACMWFQLSDYEEEHMGNSNSWMKQLVSVLGSPIAVS